MVGQFFTPDSVACAMLRLVGAGPGQHIIDPSCGDGVFLRNAPSKERLFACEIDPQYGSVVAALVPAGHAVNGDALTELRSRWGFFDLVIGNPPFSAQSHLERRAEILQTFDLGADRKAQCLEILFLELFLRLARPGGRIAIILPDGPLSNHPFHYVRTWLLRHAHVETIISLPRTTFSRTAAKTCVLLATKIPPATGPNREPTRLCTCETLERLDALGPQQIAGAPSVILADRSDWRPESLSPTAKENTPDAFVRLGDSFRLRTGFAAYAEKRELFSEPAPDRLLLLRAKNFHPDGGLRLEDNLGYISTAGLMFREAALLREGEIAFVRVGAGCYGRSALVPDGLRAQADDWLHVLTPIVEIDAAALVAWMNGPEGRRQIKLLAKGVGTVSISKSALAELEIPARFVRAGTTAPELRLAP